MEKLGGRLHIANEEKKVDKEQIQSLQMELEGEHESCAAYYSLQNDELNTCLKSSRMSPHKHSDFQILSAKYDTQWNVCANKDEMLPAIIMLAYKQMLHARTWMHDSFYSRRLQAGCPHV